MSKKIDIKLLLGMGVFEMSIELLNVRDIKDKKFKLYVSAGIIYESCKLIEVDSHMINPETLDNDEQIDIQCFILEFEYNACTIDDLKALVKLVRDDTSIFRISFNNFKLNHEYYITETTVINDDILNMIHIDYITKIKIYLRPCGWEYDIICAGG